MAWAYFSKTWARDIWGIMTCISIAGIALGVASLQVTLSVMNGFHTEITSKLLSLNPHILVMNPFLGMDVESKINEKLNEIKGLKNYTTFMYGKGLLYHRRTSHGVVIKGVNPESCQLKLTEGKWSALKNNNIILGGEITNILNLKLNDELYLIVPRIKQIGAPVIPRVEKLKLTGIYNSGIYEYDSSLVYINIEVAKKIFPDAASSGVELYINNPFEAEKTAKALKGKLSSPYYSVRTWKDRNYNLFAALKLEKTMMFIVLIMIVLVATFNIAGTLIMISVTRAKDCGIMRAIGATKKQIRMMFNFNGLLIGFTGTVIGTVTGLIAAILLKKYQFIQLPPKVYLISTLPVRVNVIDTVLIVITAMFISYLATIYPALRAGKLEVAEELRNE